MTQDTFSVRDEYRSHRKKGPNARRVEGYYRNKYKRLATNIYDWELPDELDPTILEKYLFEDGVAIIWKSKTFGLVITRCSLTGWDLNNRAKRFKPVFDTKAAEQVEELRELEFDECAVFYDTQDPDIKTKQALVLLDDLIDVRETLRQQVFNQKTPLIGIAGDVGVKNKIRNAIVDIAEGMQVLFLEDDLTKAITPLDLNAPFNITELYSHMMTIENEILEYLGIDATDAPMKKERMLVDEVEGNDELLNYFLTDRLRAREKGLELMKKHLDVEGTVKIREIERPIKLEGSLEDYLDMSGGGFDDAGY